MHNSRPCTVRCARRRYEYITAVAEAANLEQARAKPIRRSTR